MRRFKRAGSGVIVSLVALFLASSLSAQDISVAVDDVACLPIGNKGIANNDDATNGFAWATVENNVADTSVRLYFRRMHEEVEDFYYVEMNAAGEGRYWGIFPVAEDEELERINLDRDPEDRFEGYRDLFTQDDDDHRWTWWWLDKEASDHRDPNDSLDTDRIRERASLGKLEKRDWFPNPKDPTVPGWGTQEFQDCLSENGGRWDDQTFETCFLEQLENEPAEYFAAVYDSEGRRLAKSSMKATLVEEDCEVELTAQQEGESDNLVVGETATWERGKPVFHWLCEGIVSRIDPFDVLRVDDACRACVVAWWRRTPVLAAALAIPPAIIISQPDDPVSPVTP